jgi:hypothetical protein
MSRVICVAISSLHVAATYPAAFPSLLLSRGCGGLQSHVYIYISARTMGGKRSERAFCADRQMRQLHRTRPGDFATAIPAFVCLFIYIFIYLTIDIFTSCLFSDAVSSPLCSACLLKARWLADAGLPRTLHLVYTGLQPKSAFVDVKMNSDYFSTQH